MNAEEKVLVFLKEREGLARKSDLARMDMSPVTLARAMRVLLVQGHVEICVRVTEAGHRVQPRNTKERRKPQQNNYGLIVSPPQHVFKETTDEDITRIREEALSARELVG